MKEKYKMDAERQYRNMPAEKLQKELKRLSRGHSLWEWLKEKAGSFVNMVKIAALSIFLGRQETGRRVRSGNWEAGFEQLKKEAQREAKIMAIERKLGELQGGLAEMVPGAVGAEKAETMPKGHADPDKEKAPARNGQFGSKEPFGNQEPSLCPSIFEEQIQGLSEKYQNGLSEYLERQTGISRDFISVKNVTDGKDCYIRVSFDSLDLPEGSQYVQGVTVDRRGNCLEGTLAAGLLSDSILFYTAKVFRDPKNGSRPTGAVPSEKMCVEVALKFREVAKDQENNGIQNCTATDSLFGHPIDFIKAGDSFHILFDKVELDFADGWSIKAFTEQVCKAMLDKENGDYTQQKEDWLSAMMHAITKNEVDSIFYVKYNSHDLEGLFTKILDDMAHDGSGPIRRVNFHQHEVQVSFNDDSIYSVTIDGEGVYRAVDGIQENGEIAGHIADCLCNLLDRDGMYMPDEALEKMDGITNLTNSDIQTREVASDFEQAFEYDGQEEELVQ